MRSAILAVALSAFCAGLHAEVTAQPAAAPSTTVSLTPAELFRFADAARDRGDFQTAEEAYRALSSNPDIELRTEARFRLALMLGDRMNRYRDAAVLLREVLDEKPDAARVRVELARMQVALGNYGAAERELRAAQAAGLPDQVEQLVRFYASALSARKPVGGSLQVAIAPDSNINRATRSDTLETVIGNFDLSEDAQATSGIGLALRGQGYFREGIGAGADLLLRANAYGRFYRRNEFDDYVLSFQAGPEFASKRDRMTVSAISTLRWFGQDFYAFGYGGTASFRHPMDEKSRLNVDGSVIYTDDRLSDQRDAFRIAASAGIDRALSARFGAGLSLSGDRQVARDPGYSTAGGGVDGYVFREFGQTTLVANFGYSHLEADKRLFLYTHRRVDDRFELGLSGTFRALRVGPLAPLASVRFENNHSSVQLYDYQRVAVEMGITAAF